MAYAMILHQWDDGSYTKFQVGAEGSHSGAINEATRNTLRLYRAIVDGIEDTDLEELAASMGIDLEASVEGDEADS